MVRTLENDRLSPVELEKRLEHFLHIVWRILRLLCRAALADLIALVEACKEPV